MDLSTAILGTTAVEKLQERLAIPVLVIGSDHFTRRELATVDCFNFLAAANLNAALKDLGVKHTKDLFTNYPPSALALPRIGIIALAVIGAAFEAKGIGGDHPLEAWMIRHSKDKEAGIRTFSTLKAQLHKEAAAEKQARKKRQRQRQKQAHEIRVERHLARTEAADQERTE